MVFRIEPPLTMERSVFSTKRYASATKSPKLVSPLRTRRLPVAGSSLVSVTMASPTGWFRIASNRLFSLATSAVTLGSAAGSVLIRVEESLPSSWITSCPNACSLVPVWVTSTSLPMELVTLWGGSYCSWEWPSITASILYVWAAMAPLDHFGRAPFVPRWPTRIT